MSISSNINVTSDVEGTYTLAELLDLLGSPKRLKDVLAELEKATKADTEAYEILKTTEAKRQVEMAQDSAQRLVDLEKLSKSTKVLEEAKEKLVEDTAASNAEISKARSNLRDDEAKFKNQVAATAGAVEALKVERKSLDEERELLLTQSVKEREVAEQYRVEGEKAHDEAKKVLAEAEAKVAEMRKVLS